MAWVALDIGGANLKVADGQGFAASRLFELWKYPDRLVHALRECLSQAPAADHLAVTMTGEIADCFADKQEGVRFILGAVDQARDGRHARVYTTRGCWLSIPAALRATAEVAASNWYGLAKFAGRFLSETEWGLLIDVGSTTTDILPIRRAGPLTESRTDLDRLLQGELLYTGVVRSPICGIVRTAPYRGRSCPVAHELFANVRDAYILLGFLPEDPGDVATPDGRPATKAYARARLGRMLCADSSEFHHKDALEFAQHVFLKQIRLVQDAIARKIAALGERIGPPGKILLCGSGEFLAEECIVGLGKPARLVSLRQKLGLPLSLAAPAHALACLAREEHGEGANRHAPACD